MLLLLQIQGVSGGDLNPVTYLELLPKGGVTMIVIIAMFTWAIGLACFKLLRLQRASKIPPNLLTQVKTAVLNNSRQQAITICKNNSSSLFGRILHKAVVTYFANQTNPTSPTKEVIENQCQLEVDILEKNISAFATIATLAPMVGFFGTVIGMISAFMSISEQAEGAVSPKLLSTGIYEAMVTTAAGLVVGMLAHFLYNYMTNRLNDIIHKMKKTSFGFMDMLHGNIS